MKNTILTLFATLYSSLLILNSPAALPEDWEVDLAAQPPQVFTLQRPRGETYELKAALKRHGKPFAPAITNACIYWQTNGMENLYWSAPASVSNNVLRAFWLPEMDPGATTVRGYIGDPGQIYAAAFQFRFIASPGPLPNALPLPTPVIDFAKVRVLNPPWSGGGGGGGDTNTVIDIANATIATNALVVATTNRVAALETATNNLTSSVSTLASSVSSLQSSKADKSELSNFLSIYGGAVDTGFYLDAMYGTLGIMGGPDGGPMWGCSGNFYVSGFAYVGGYDWSWLKNFTGSLQDVLDDLAPLSMIHHTNPSFSNEVATVARTVTPPPSPTLRLYDEVRQCYWLGKMVNGVMQWEVE